MRAPRTGRPHSAGGQAPEWNALENQGLQVYKICPAKNARLKLASRRQPHGRPITDQSPTDRRPIAIGGGAAHATTRRFRHTRPAEGAAGLEPASAAPAAAAARTTPAARSSLGAWGPANPRDK